MHLSHFQYKIHDEVGTKILAQKLADICLHAFNSNNSLEIDFTIHLKGQLGAGKTTFARTFLNAFGLKKHIKSPTYSLLEPYNLVRENKNLCIYHFDLYRMHTPEEWFDSGFDEYFSHSALRIIEWPDHARSILPVPDFLLSIALTEQGREFNIEAFSKIGKYCLKQLVADEK